MKKIAWKLVLGAVGASFASISYAQVSDTLNDFDPGSPSAGMGGVLHTTSSDTFSTYYNPAGLGFISKRTFGLGYRNLPKSHSTSLGNFNSRSVDYSGTPGPRALSHGGLVFPLDESAKRKMRGAVGLSYEIGGTMDDLQTATSLTLGTDAVTNYSLLRSFRTDFYNLGYGVSNGANNFAFGVSVNFARQKTQIDEHGTLQSSSAAFPNVDHSDDNGRGVGVTVGIQGTPAGSNNVNYGISVRTPITLSGLANTKDDYGKIPGRIMGGLAYRKDNLRGGEDFLILGAEIAHYYGGSSSNYFDRNNQTVGAFGFEYDLARAGGHIPLRVGYRAVPSGGDGFSSRNVFTYGIGYRPTDSRFALNANFGAPEHGGYDVSLGLDVRIDK